MGMSTLANVNWNTAASLTLADARDTEERSNRWISDKSGIPEVSVQRYLAGTRAVSVEHFAAIARALGRDPLALFAEVEARVQNDQ